MSNSIKRDLCLTVLNSRLSGITHKKHHKTLTKMNLGNITHTYCLWSQTPLSPVHH